MSTADAFFTALKTGDAATIKELCADDPSLARTPVTNKAGIKLAPIFAAVALGQVDSVKALLEVDETLIREAGPNGITLMHAAATVDDAAIIHALHVVDKNFIHIASQHGFLPLDIAIGRKSVNAIQALITLGADVREEMFTHTDLTPELFDLLRDTYEEQQAARVGKAVTASPEPEPELTPAPETYYFEDLMSAASAGDENAFIALLEEHPDLARTQDQIFGMTALSLAAHVGFSNGIRVIHALNPEASAAMNGVSVLQIAVMNNHLAATKTLAELYPDLVNTPNHFDRTPFDYALDGKDIPLIELLIAHHAQIERKHFKDLPEDSELYRVLQNAYAWQRDRAGAETADGTPRCLVGDANVIEGTVVKRLSGPAPE